MTMIAKFDGTCKRCNCKFAKGTTIDWSRGYGAVHASTAACDAAKAAKRASYPAPTVKLNMTPVADFILAAKLRGVRFPSVSFLAPNGEGVLTLKVAGSMAAEPGAVNVLVNEQWLGRINPNGDVIGHKIESRAALLEQLGRIATDPAGMAKEYGALTGHCSFCHRKLTDAGSIEVGYGPVCADAYGLPHKPKGSAVLKPIGVGDESEVIAAGMAEVAAGEVAA